MNQMKTHDSQFEPWRSETRHVTYQSRTPWYEISTNGRRRNITCAFHWNLNTRGLAWHVLLLTTTPEPLFRCSLHLRLPHTAKTPRDCLKRDFVAHFRKSQKSWYYDGSMPHQKDCCRLCVASYCSDPSGDRVGPLVGVEEATVTHCDRVPGHASRNDVLWRLSMSHDYDWSWMFLTTASDATKS